MGVTGLWTLVDSVGHPVNLESLHNKVIAIDLSLWINQSIKGIRGRNGQVVESAHVLGLFNRICKLLFYKIKPVFVFDGKCPQLKQNTISKRAEQRLKAIDKSREASVKILHNYIATQLSSSDQRLPIDKSLPPLKSSALDLSDNKNFKIYEELSEIEKYKQFEDNCEESDSDSDSEPNIAHNYKNIQNLDSMDLNSEEFKSLPPDIKYEILTEMRLKFKGYRNTDIMPKETNDFSNYQLQRLLKKRGLQSKIEDTIKQLNGEHSEDILQNWNKGTTFNENELNAGRLMSDESTRFIFIKKSQTIDSQKSSEENCSKDICSPSVPSIDNNSVHNSCHRFVSIDSSDSEEIQINSSKTSENNTKINEINEQNSKICSNKSLFDKTIEISDESNVEEEEEEEFEIIKNINKIIGNNSKNSEIHDSKNAIESIDSKNKMNVRNEFTKIKTIEVNSDSSDDEFIEVLPQTSDSTLKLISENLLSNEEFNDNQIKSIDSNENSLNFDEFSQSIEVNEEIEVIKEINDSNIRILEPKSNTSDLIDNECVEPKASTSSSVEFTAISREELLETTREVNKQNRFANHTTDQMMTDCQELLSLFGIPFVMSPTEAEAQCAALELMSLTDGTITDDSDALLFGAQTVYKNFFTSSKYVELFKACDIETRFGLTRSSMINIAMLCGSDYTDGVDGVGAVTATEILSEFRGDGLKPLIDLKNWWESKQKSVDKRPENKIRAKLMKLKLSESFPNRVIFEAYMNPSVDTSTEKFVWGIPRLDELRRYAALRFRWTVEKCDQILLPIMKKVNEKQTQMTIDNYFKIQVQPKDTSLASKRISKAIEKLRGIESEPQTNQSISKTSALSQKVKNQRKKRQTKGNKSGVQSKRRQTFKAKPQEINLSESSESD